MIPVRYSGSDGKFGFTVMDYPYIHSHIFQRIVTTRNENVQHCRVFFKKKHAGSSILDTPFNLGHRLRSKGLQPVIHFCPSHIEKGLSGVAAKLQGTNADELANIGRLNSDEGDEEANSQCSGQATLCKHPTSEAVNTKRLRS